MTNQLTRKIMDNIIARCSDMNRVNEQKVNLRQKELDVLKNIIYKNKDIQPEKEINNQNSNTERNITLDQLINSKINTDKTKMETHEKSKPDIKDNGVRKINLDDIVPKVSLASIGKKR